MASISEDTGEETPLQVRLNGVATFIGIVGLAVALFVLIVLLCRFFTGNTKNPDGTTQFVHGKTSVSKSIDGVVHIITAAVSSCPLGFVLVMNCNVVETFCFTAPRYCHSETFC
ncbi:calcium-transporting ATPase 5, plasma membrane-type-like [Nicotiana tabacum]|uniref:calcium-transporting ATPase 5, plasma membrane-type-like n=1 Tax=Nicotiana tabacum TaxID=4097 RepID=UPI003F4F08FD